ncbi:hypothetical protein V1291_000297 [Nitrobacteraceae bacterium AZCC 1564]
MSRRAVKVAKTIETDAMMRFVYLPVLTGAVLLAPVAQPNADESKDGTIEVVTAALGEVLALGDLCGWDFAAKVDKLYQNGKKTLNLTAAQEKAIRTEVAAARNATFGHLSADGQARVRADVCKDEQRARLEGILDGISFD